MQGYYQYVGQLKCECWITELSLASRCAHTEVMICGRCPHWPPFARPAFASELRASWVNDRLTEKTWLMAQFGNSIQAFWLPFLNRPRIVLSQADTP